MSEFVWWFAAGYFLGTLVSAAAVVFVLSKLGNFRVI